MLPGATPEEELAIKRALEWRRKNPVGSLGWQQAASQPAQAYQGAELPPTNPAQPPVYQNQPLAAAQPQGVSKVDETEDTEVPAGALDFANMTPEAFSTGLNDVLRQASSLAPVMGQKDYEAAKQKIMERRFGPSRAEQLFALSAALLKPTYAGNRFGQIMGNVVPALGEAERQNREASTAREAALEQLKQQYMTGTNAAQRQKLEALLSVYKTAAPVVAAKMKPRTPVAKVYTDALGVTRHKIYGSKIVEPPIDKINALKSYLANPNNTEQDKLITAKNFDAAYGYGATDIYGGE